LSSQRVAKKFFKNEEQTMFDSYIQREVDIDFEEMLAILCEKHEVDCPQKFNVVLKHRNGDYIGAIFTWQEDVD
jgi:hypothetical protein